MTVRDWRVRCTTSLPALPHACVIFVDARPDWRLFDGIEVSQRNHPKVLVCTRYWLLLSLLLLLSKITICWPPYACCAILV